MQANTSLYRDVTFVFTQSKGKKQESLSRIILCVKTLGHHRTYTEGHTATRVLRIGKAQWIPLNNSDVEVQSLTKISDRCENIIPHINADYATRDGVIVGTSP